MEMYFIFLLVFMQYGKSQSIQRTTARNVSDAKIQTEEFPCRGYYRHEETSGQKEFKVKMIRIDQHPRLSDASKGEGEPITDEASVALPAVTPGEVSTQDTRKKECAERGHFGNSEVYCTPEAASCYKIVGTWVQAKGNCQRLGSNLVSIETAGEQDYLATVLGLVSLKLEEMKLLRRVIYWTGGNDLYTEGDWRWVSGNQFTYNGWYPGEPNDRNGVEDCLELWNYKKWMWNDVSCRSKLASICEITC